MTWVLLHFELQYLVCPPFTAAHLSCQRYFLRTSILIFSHVFCKSPLRIYNSSVHIILQLAPIFLEGAVVQALRDPLHYFQCSSRRLLLLVAPAIITMLILRPIQRKQQKTLDLSDAWSEWLQTLKLEPWKRMHVSPRHHFHPCLSSQKLLISAWAECLHSRLRAPLSSFTLSLE